MVRPSRRRVLTALGVLAPIPLAGCRARWPWDGETEPGPPERFDVPVDVGSGSVPSYQYDSHNTGVAPTGGPTEDPEIYWLRHVGSFDRSPPVVSGDRIYCSLGGTTFALDRRDGSQIWRRYVGPTLGGGAPAIADGTVVIANSAHQDEPAGVHALNAADGTHRWQAREGQNVGCAVTIRDGRVYTGGGLDEDRLVALDLQDGTVLWSNAVGEYVTTPAVTEDRVVVGGGKGRSVTGFEMDGSLAWTLDVGQEVWAAPTIVEDTVYLGTRGDEMLALTAADGEVVWRRDVESEVSSSCAVGTDAVYATTVDGLTAMARDDGEILWERSFDNFHDTPPVLAKGVVYVAADDEVIAFDADDGSRLWSRSVREIQVGDQGFRGVRNQPVVVDGVVFVATFPGDLYALGPAEA